jgi:hypothetical protein
MIPLSDLRNLSTEKAELAIFKTLAYFDIFDYPLSEKEIKHFLGTPLHHKEFQTALENMVLGQTVFKVSEFYSLHDNPAKIQERLRGNLRAVKLLANAIKIGSFLYKFPYVRAVAISGSLSKGYAEEKADIDFFIITRANRLWLARTILHLFKKLTFLTGRQHLYCMNYFIDEDALVIREKNIYTATEIVTLLPVSGYSAIKQFSEVNKWVQEWLPEYTSFHRAEMFESNSLFKKLTEWFFDGRLGVWLDDILFRWTTRRWQKKERRGQKNSKGRVMSLITDKHFSKSDPEAFQKKIITLYERKIKEFRTH